MLAKWWPLLPLAWTYASKPDNCPVTGLIGDRTVKIGRLDRLAKNGTDHKAQLAATDDGQIVHYYRQ
jgi:hypothetical protein